MHQNLTCVAKIYNLIYIFDSHEMRKPNIGDFGLFLRIFSSLHLEVETITYPHLLHIGTH